MSQESFIYSFVARGTMVLAEYTEFTGNFPAIAAQCLQKLPSSNNKFTYNCDHHTFNFLVEDGYAYCVVAKESVSKQISIAFLERVKADFKKRYGGGKADTAIAKSLNKEFGPVMKEHMKYIIDHAEEIVKLIKVKAQVSEVKSIMLENIDKYESKGIEGFDSVRIAMFVCRLLYCNFWAIDRGENLTILADKTETLRSQVSKVDLGSRFQKARNTSPSEDVVSEHEN
ncbi:Vesicle-associated membrane protein 724 [Glycine soja]|uniref:Vesicle-associated membrane protein 724 n=1 Tax=Glycine soja TaxID=3848 RepID=A0A0B2PZU4_GLYSO|nr:Vesicle-associated membrane protein 724 [Glycine soja]